MQQAQPRAPLDGPTFIRLLARLTNADVQPPGQTLSERLGQWIDWNHAVALSRALDGGPVPSSESVPVADQDACDRARATLAAAIASHHDWSAGADVGHDYAVLRERHLLLQRSMLAATGRLRGELREALAQRSPDLARLAEVDALMERVLSPREHLLLGTVPELLGRHFARLQQAAGDSASTSFPWFETFRRDMHSVLLAELDIRFQPVQALRAALRPH